MAISLGDAVLVFKGDQTDLDAEVRDTDRKSRHGKPYVVRRARATPRLTRNSVERSNSVIGRDN
jgi:hypothetical protein